MNGNGHRQRRSWNPGPPFPVEARGCLYVLIFELVLIIALAVVVWWLG